MATMNISLPDLMKSWVKPRSRTDGQYADVSDYVRDLIRRDREHKEKQRRLHQAIQAGLDSGISARTPDEILASARARLQNPD